MKKKGKVKFPAKYDQEKAVKDMRDRMWRAIEGCTAEEYFDKVREESERKRKTSQKRERAAGWWDS